MTARERDPQGVSGPAARLEAIRERHKKYDNEAICQYCAETWPCTVAWLLARLAPATPSGAATAGDARAVIAARGAHAALLPQVVIDPRDPERKAVAFVLDATLSRIAEGVRVLTVDVGFDFGGGPLQRHVKRVHVPPVAPASAARSGAAPEATAPVNGVCCSCSYAGVDETPCEKRDDKTHCEHWWDGPDEAAPEGPATAAGAGDGWQETAAQESRNRDYYRALVVEIGEMFGDAAYIADDGGRADDVLCAKVPELVRTLMHAAPPAAGSREDA